MTVSTGENLQLKFSGEFVSTEKETSFLRFSWGDYKAGTRYSLWIIAFMGAAFAIRDVIELGDGKALYFLVSLRFFVAGLLVATAEYIQRSKTYSEKKGSLLFFCQVIITIAVAIAAVVRDMPFTYVAVNTILLTLIYYQFISNRFYYTVTACAVLALTAILVSWFFLDMDVSGLVASILFLIPVNLLGILMLRTNNRIKRSRYAALEELRESNEIKEGLIQDLQAALEEVKTLQGFIPICANCMKIRDDKGFWERIESYFQARTGAQFSHSICPDCSEKLYPDLVKSKGKEPQE